MIPGNVDPRRPEKVQRYKPPQANGNNAPTEDLTPDYMNILGPDSATANADAAADNVKQQPQSEDHPAPSASAQETSTAASSNGGTNVIPTSPQYGVAIMSSNGDVPQEVVTSSTDTVVETTAKGGEESKDGGNMHSTPSRNDRFKVVKIASLEPFRRGRWKCMDYVDENPPAVSVVGGVNKVGISGGGAGGGGLYMQTQSLPQQHFQQMLVQQGVFANQQQFYQNVPVAQMLPQNQYFYPAPATVASMQQMGVQQQAGMQQQFINANQQYFQQNVVPHSTAGYNYSNVQYVPTANLIQNQGSAFVPTTQNVNPQLPPNFQQSQTYAGPPSGNQPLVNGHAFPLNPTEPAQVVASSLPTQVAKNVILNAANVVPTPQQQQQQQQQQSLQPNIVAPNNNNTIPSQVIPNQQLFTTNYQPVSAPSTVVLNNPQNPVGYDVYTNPQFVASVVNNSVTETNPSSSSAEDPAGGDSNSQENSEITASGDDPAKANPVVNAIDNKIEQAMDLVKSHLMYTVREEVEVLKEKIAELMERIQQLETENNFLKQQIPKGGAAPNSNPSGTPDPPQ